MEEVKIWWQSKTIWAAIITVVSLLSYLFGVGPMLTGTEISSMVEIAVIVVSSLATIWARVAATKQVVLSKPE